MLASAFLLPQGKWVSSGYRLAGFPLPIYKLLGCPGPNDGFGCFETEFLPFNLAANFAFWTLISAGLVHIATKNRGGIL
jgi:hypothetical protein